MNNHPIRMKERAKKEIRAVYPLMVAMITRKGYIAPRADVVKSFSEAAVEMAVAENIMTDTKIIKRYKDLKKPGEMMRALQLAQYKGERPEWLDE